MSKLITASKLNRLWKNGILPIKQDVSNLNTALDVVEEKVDNLLENGGGGVVGSIASKIVCTCTGDNAIGTILTGTISGKTYKATVGTDNTATFMIPDVGNFVITGTEEYYVNTSILIEYFSIYNVDISPVTIESWVESGGLNPSSYASLDELLEDEAAVRTLITKKASVDSLVRMPLSNLTTIISHRYVAKWVNYREYAYSTLSTRASIKALMDEAGMYGMYITAESKIKPLVPVMTSNTTPYGEAFASNVNANSGAGESYAAWRMFDGDEKTNWATDTNISTATVGYKFVNPTCVRRFKMQVHGASPKTFDLEASNDRTNWYPIKSYSLDTAPTAGDVFYFDSDENDSYYMYYQINIKSSYKYNGITIVGINELQFYGYQLEGLVPTMTSNTAPEGEAFASNEYGSGYEAYKAFDLNVSTNWGTTENKRIDAHIGYHFVNPVKVKKIYMLAVNSNGSSTCRFKDFVIEASNNGTNYEVLYSGTYSITTSANEGNIYTLSNDDAYLYYRVRQLGDNYTTHNSTGLFTLQFYGEPTLWQPKGLVPVMTSNTTPYGEAFASDIYNNNDSYAPWRMFNALDDGWVSNHYKETSPSYTVGYKFVNPTCVRRFKIQVPNASPREFDLVASNDGSTWHPLQSYVIDSVPTAGDIFYFDVDEYNSYYIHYQLKIKTSYGYNNINCAGLNELQFYGRQLEALIPPMTSNTTPVGEADATSYYTSYDPYKAFTGVSNSGSGWVSNYGTTSLFTNQRLIYKFDTPITIKRIMVEAKRSKDIAIEMSSDGNNWEPIKEWTQSPSDVTNSAVVTVIDLDEPITCQYISYLGKTTHMTSTNASPHWVISLQVYGAPDYESRTYIYDHGVEVMGLTTYNNNSVHTINMTSDAIEITGGGATGKTSVYTISKIDSSNYSLLNSKVDGNTATTFDRFYIAVSNVLPSDQTGNNYSLLAYLYCSSNVTKLDLNSVDQEVYIITGFSSNGAVTGTMTVSEFWLE